MESGSGVVAPVMVPLSVPVVGETVVSLDVVPAFGVPFAVVDERSISPPGTAGPVVGASPPGGTAISAGTGGTGG